MNKRGNTVKPMLNQDGSALIFSILILFILTLLGILATNTTDWELKFAGGDRVGKDTFYQAESGAEGSKELIEQSIEERGWPDLVPDADGNLQVGEFKVANGDLFQNDALGNDLPTDADRDAAVVDADGSATNIRIGADGRLSTGGAIQMLGGYEGLGKGSAGGGAWIIYDVRSQHDGKNNSSSRVKIQWLHVM